VTDGSARAGWPVGVGVQGAARRLALHGGRGERAGAAWEINYCRLRMGAF